MLIITSNSVATSLGTKVAHNGNAADVNRAMREANDLDKQKSDAATARAKNAGYNKPLSVEQIRSGSWRDQTVPLRVRMATEAAEQHLASNPKLAISLLRSSVDGAKAKLAASNYQDAGAEREIEMLEALIPEYEERARFLAEVRPTPESDAPAVPAWIEQDRQRVRDSFDLTPEQKRTRLASLDALDRQEQAKLDEAERKRVLFDRSDFTSALCDAQLSVQIAAMAHDGTSIFLSVTMKSASLPATSLPW